MRMAIRRREAGLAILELTARTVEPNEGMTDMIDA